jgi:magnesium transporter
VIGIVAFGSINSGLASETDAAHLTYLWRRGGWLWFFFLMAISLICTYIFTNELETVFTSRSDLAAEPFAGMSARRQKQPATSFAAKVRDYWESLMLRIREFLESWTAPHGDKQIAWTLGIGWACCGGGLAGMCLVFAKAAVKLITGSLSHENTGNQFGHVSSIFTFVLLAITAVFQIICLNRGLRVYDSTLVVPVFYGVYTAAGYVVHTLISSP